MRKWTKWIAVGLLVAIPTIGFAVTRYRSRHEGCSNMKDCPLKKHK